MYNFRGVGNSLDPETVKLIMDLAVPLLEELVEKISKNQSYIKSILEKVDQIFLRDISSAFDAINDATLTNNEAARERRLNYAEEQLLRCTGLNIDSKNNIGKYSPAYWVSLSHFGLFTVSKLRGDKILAVRHVLKTYLAEPKIARTNHFPGVYRILFRPKCIDVENWYNAKLAEINKEDCHWRVLGDKALIVGKGLGLGAMSLAAIKYPHVRHAAGRGMVEGFKKLGEEWKDVSPEKHRDELKNQLNSEYEEKLNIKCKSIAKSMLN